VDESVGKTLGCIFKVQFNVLDLMPEVIILTRVM